MANVEIVCPYCKTEQIAPDEASIRERQTFVTKGRNGTKGIKAWFRNRTAERIEEANLLIDIICKNQECGLNFKYNTRTQEVTP